MHNHDLDLRKCEDGDVHSNVDCVAKTIHKLLQTARYLTLDGLTTLLNKQPKRVFHYVKNEGQKGVHVNAHAEQGSPVPEQPCEQPGTGHSLAVVHGGLHLHFVTVKLSLFYNNRVSHVYTDND